MTGVQLAFFITLCVIAFSVFMYVFSAIVASYFVVTMTLKRRDKKSWSRTPVLEGVQKEMYDEGMAWHEENVSKKIDVHIVNDSLNLYGEYYDFGSDRCVIILSGRTESLTYGYYFASPYAKSGFNVLVIDPRAHGLSDGVYNTVGFEESKDAIAWAEFIHNKFGVKSIIFHGICIGGAAGTLALTSEKCPDYIEGIVVEGMFANFGESLKNHMIEQKKPLFINYWFIRWRMKRYTGVDMDYGPIDVISKLKKPILFIQSKEDIYSLPDYTKKMYDLCGSKIKSITWFEHGNHSMLRPNDKEKYDEAIKNHVEKIYSTIGV